MPPPYIHYTDSYDLRRKVPSRAHPLIRPFLEQCTDSRGLSSLTISLWPLASPQYPRWTGMLTDDPMLAAFTRHALGEEASGEHAELVRATRAVFPPSGDFHVMESSVGKQIAALRWDGESRVARDRPWRAAVPDAPTHDAFQMLLERWEAARIPYSLFVDYTFLLVDHGGALLPYSDEHFEDYIWSFVHLHLDNGGRSRVTYNLKLPWSEPDAALSEFVAKMRETLTRFDSTFFRLHSGGVGRKEDKGRPLTWEM